MKGWFIFSCASYEISNLVFTLCNITTLYPSSNLYQTLTALVQIKCWIRERRVPVYADIFQICKDLHKPS